MRMPNFRPISRSTSAMRSIVLPLMPRFGIKLEHFRVITVESYKILWDRNFPQYENDGVYAEYMKNQLTELLTQYGPVISIFFDGKWDKDHPTRTWETDPTWDNDPNSGLGHGERCWFCTGTPYYVHPSVDTICGWYNTAREHDANLLLNVGPDKNGLIPDYNRHYLLEAAKRLGIR